jgi:hypothetical protein
MDLLACGDHRVKPYAVLTEIQVLL